MHVQDEDTAVVVLAVVAALEAQLALYKCSSTWQPQSLHTAPLVVKLVLLQHSEQCVPRSSS
jgi:hypothetical protein